MEVRVESRVEQEGQFGVFNEVFDEWSGRGEFSRSSIERGRAWGDSGSGAEGGCGGDDAVVL